MNINEVARRAKVSTATVSRAINRVPTVDRQLARRVLRVVQELGYFPNTHARSLVSGRSRIVGLIISEIVNPFVPEIVQAFEEIAFQHGYEILLGSIGHDPRRTEWAVRRMIERRVEGVAILTFGIEHSQVDKLQFLQTPVVFVGGDQTSEKAINIQIDYENGIRQAVQHLAALRHQRIAFIGGPAHSKSTAVRNAIFEQSLHEIGIDVAGSLIVPANDGMQGGISALSMLTNLPEPPTAVICSNDLTALGVMRQAYDLGIQVPHDLSVVGFGDIRLAQFTIPPLTTIRISQDELVRLAFSALMKSTNAFGTGSEYILRSSLIIRGSTRLILSSTHRSIADI